jgi:hypothetical protein
MNAPASRIRRRHPRIRRPPRSGLSKRHWMARPRQIGTEILEGARAEARRDRSRHHGPGHLRHPRTDRSLAVTVFTPARRLRTQAPGLGARPPRTVRCSADAAPRGGQASVGAARGGVRPSPRLCTAYAPGTNQVLTRFHGDAAPPLGPGFWPSASSVCSARGARPSRATRSAKDAVRPKA